MTEWTRTKKAMPYDEIDDLHPTIGGVGGAGDPRAALSPTEAFL